MLNKQITQKEEVRLDANVGEHIGYELGAKMIKDYYDKYQEGGAHFVGRNIIEKILSQPDCIGIKIFKGLNEEGKKTYVLTGVNSEGQPILEITAVNPNGEMKIEEGIVADRKTFTGWVDIIFD
jgi:DhnA family fructose-bisphosphate aldolase class Ia